MSRLPRKWLVSRQMNWVLSAFSRSRFNDIQVFTRSWWRPWLGQPDQRHLPAYTSRETVHCQHTDARQIRAIQPVSEYRPYRERTGEGQAPSPAPHQNALLRNVRQIHSSELSTCDRRWMTASSRMLILWARRRWTVGRAGWSDRPCRKWHSHQAKPATRSVPCPLRRECVIVS